MEKLVKLKDLGAIFIGLTYKPEDVSDNGTIVLRSGNIQEGQFDLEDIVRVSCPIKHNLVVHTDDILMCSRNGSARLVGKCTLIPDLTEPMMFGAFMTIIRTPYNRYLRHFFDSHTFRAQLNGSATTTINQITKRMLDDIVVPFPSLGEQQKIACVLDKINDLTFKRKRQLEKLDELVKARFVEMFGDCLTNPKGWKTKCLEDIAEVGSSKRVFVEELQEEGIPFYRGTEVGALAEGKQIVPELFITEQHYNELCEATGAPQIGDLLMPSICPDGRIWVVNTNEPFYFKDGRVLWVHAIDSSYNPIFLLYTLKDRIMTDYSSIASGTTFAELKIFALKKCRIFDVPLEQQNQFAAFIEQTDKSKAEIKKSLEQLEMLKKALMQKYFG